jgi:hypothetical protein
LVDKWFQKISPERNISPKKYARCCFKIPSLAVK